MRTKRQRSKKTFARLMRFMGRRATPAVMLLFMTMLAFADLPTFQQHAIAQPSSQFPPFVPQLPPFVGRVCIVPGESTSCPLTLPTIIVPPSIRFNVSINILGSTIFNTFNISVRWDPTVANSTTVDLNQTVLPAFTITTRCINGEGLGCGSLEGPGIAHVVAVGTNTTAPTSGRLFKILFLGNPGLTLRLGFQTGCSSNSVPNTSSCVIVAIVRTVGTPSATLVPEGIQSQLLGVPLPTPLASVQPPGNITAIASSGGGPNFADTYVMPYPIALEGNITTWKVQFRPLQVPLSGVNVTIDSAGVQIKVLRRVNATTLTVVGAGRVHDPRPILQSRLPSYPFVKTEWTVIEFYADPGIAVQPGDLIGLTIMSDPSLRGYYYPLVNATGTRFVSRNVLVNGTIDLNDAFTGTLPNGWGPALQVFIQVPPPALDTAGDGITDFVKLSPEMQALGADPCRKTVAVQLDYMVRPLQAAIETVVASFDAAPVNATLPCPYLGFPLKPSGVKLIIDVKNQIPMQDVLNFTHSEPQSFDSVKAAFFDPNRVHSFHYGIWAHDMAPQSSVSGVGEIFGSNFIVSLREWPGGGTVKEQAGTLMHELGHNLGLDHGGNNVINFKPDYLSVMNYAFQVVGIPSQTAGGGNVTRFDYSSQALPPLNESSLDETMPLSSSNDFTRWACPDGRHVDFGLVSAPLDWNCNGQTDSGKVMVDINNDTTLETLTGYNDWANLRYKFTESESFGIGCHIGCDIGCHIGCDIGTELTYPQAAIIETQLTHFLASPHHATSAAITCSPASVPANGASSCTVTITDIDGTPLTPTGTVSFTSSQAGSFAPADNCTLAGTGASASCSVTYTLGPSGLGAQIISAAYVGDTNHLGSSGSTTITLLSASLSVHEFFTDPANNPLPLDSNGNPKVDVVLAGGIVKSTNPGEIITWVNVTNTGPTPFQSLRANETLPVDWIVAPTWTPGKGAVHVFFANTTSLLTSPEITDPKTISVTTGNPETVLLAIPNLNATGIGHPLLPGQSILLAVKLDFGLAGTSQSGSSFPRNYTDTASAAAWAKPSYIGSQATTTASRFFIVYAKVVGDVNGDGKVDITDLVLVARSFGAAQGSLNWNPAADLNNDGVINISDLTIVGASFGS